MNFVPRRSIPDVLETLVEESRPEERNTVISNFLVKHVEGSYFSLLD